MNDIEYKKRMQVLQMAKIILTEENTKQFNQEYKNWIATNDVSWRTQRVKLAIPIAPSPPTEAAIVARALEFYKATDVEVASVGIAPTAVLSDNGDVVTDNATTIIEQPDAIAESTQSVADPILDPVRKIFEVPTTDSDDYADAIEPTNITNVPTSGVRDMLTNLFQQKRQPNKIRSLDV